MCLNWRHPTWAHLPVDMQAALQSDGLQQIACSRRRAVAWGLLCLEGVD